MENDINVNTWEKRMQYSLIRYVASNAYLAAKLEGCLDNQADWQEDLALELLTNEMEGAPSRKSPSTRNEKRNAEEGPEGGSRPKPSPRGATSSVDPDPSLRHQIKTVKDLQTHQNRVNPKGTCRMCRHNSSHFYCVTCSNLHGGSISYLCGPGTGRDCMSWHCQQL